MNQKVALIILDGWGIGDHTKADAIFHAKTPFVDGLDKYPHAQLLTDGESVGLPRGQMGNSEVGHLNIGAGRIVYQELTRINKAIITGELAENKVLIEAFEKAKSKNVNLHFMGLVSDGGVHSSQEHLHALCDYAVASGVEKTYIHAFTDGRDCDPKSGKNQLGKLQEHIKNKPVHLASVIGRYYAMDRDKRWERIKKAYDLLTQAKGDKYQRVDEVFDNNYDKGITDEFIDPAVLVDAQKNPIASIQEGDVVVCFNFRTDRCREITLALTQQDFLEQEMKALDLDYFTMTMYDKTFKNVNVIFQKENLVNTLGEVVSKNGKSQLRIAETEKYPHVTFFFSGGREQIFEKEERIMINSPKVATYDLQPEMSAKEVTMEVTNYMKSHHPDFICLNFANPDMVGHTGVYEAIIKAVETVDQCLQNVVETGFSMGYEFLIIADHGNADVAFNQDGSPNTAHSTNPVPMYLITSSDIQQLKSGILADVAPTILKLMGIKQPDEMTGKSCY